MFVYCFLIVIFCVFLSGCIVRVYDFDDLDEESIVSIESNGKQYYLADNNKPFVRLEVEICFITDEQRKQMYSVILEHIGRWRYGNAE